jgi:peptidoglycan/xylan/chitin deacetylase (PgdA/CDA1 family)
MNAKTLLLVSLALGLTVVALGGYRLMNSRSFQVAGEIVPRVETDRRVVALTFDDGPTPEHTDEVLKVLDEEGVEATFYLVGEEIERHPEAAERIVAAGHELGNHSYSHRRMVLVSGVFVEREVEATDRLIRQAGYGGEIHFRPPYGKKLVSLPRYLARTGRTTVTWDVEPETDPDVDGHAGRITAHVLTNTRPGSIILLHPMYDDREASREAITPIIRGLEKKGYSFVTVSELLALE